MAQAAIGEGDSKMRLVPLGDQAIIAYFDDESAAILFAAALREANPPWLQDVTPAYASVGVYFDADRIPTKDVIAYLEEQPTHVGRSPGRSQEQPTNVGRSPGRSPRIIPVCYEMALDMPRICEHAGLSPDEAIRLHTSMEYTVYAIGFVPGFPYLGYLPREFREPPRLPSPRLEVKPGSVGLAGHQTGIYPLPRPGGWNIIGRTPLAIVHVADGFFPLRVGDRVKFERIDEAEYRRREGERLG